MLEKIICGIDYPLAVGELSQTSENFEFSGFLEELLDKAHLPKNFAKPALQLFSEKKREIDLRNGMAFLVLCLHNTLQSHEIPLSLRELSNLSGIELKKLSLVQKHAFAGNEDMVLLPSQIANRYSSQLGLSSSQCLSIVNQLRDMEKSNCFTRNPASLTGACIFSFSQRHRLKLKLKDICHVCNVSEISIKRALKRYSL